MFALLPSMLTPTQSNPNSPIALSQQAADRYEETVITPFVRTARVSAKFDSRLGLFR